MRIYRRIGPVFVAANLGQRDIWIGRGHLLIGIRDHRKTRPLFSERNDVAPHRHYRHLGPWCFHLDTNWMNRRKAAK